MWSIDTFDKKKHDRELFDCGNQDMNEWLKKHSSQSDARGSTLTRVMTHQGDSRVVGYYSQASYRLAYDDLREAFGENQKYPVPCVLLARLARCESVQGQGVGEVLLSHALRSCVRVSLEVGVQFVIVHAIDDDAVMFYKKYGFIQFEENQNHLFIPLKVLRKQYS